VDVVYITTKRTAITYYSTISCCKDENGSLAATALRVCEKVITSAN